MKSKHLNLNPNALKLIKLSIGNRVHEQLLNKGQVVIEAEAGITKFL
jgi:hypothetical protein